VQSESDADSRARTNAAMERYAAGDDSAFTLVYDGIAPRLLGYLLRHTKDRGDAEDLAQQTMLHIHRSRGSFIPGADVAPWAFAIARRLLVDRVRNREPGRRVDNVGLDTRASETPGADDLLQARQTAVHIESALAHLPQAQREAFQLIKQEGLSLCEAARILGTTVGAAKVRVHRAYEALRAALADAETLRRGAR
jgi:RNA polymerase sigma-70 factor, ECF subfamily